MKTFRGKQATHIILTLKNVGEINNRGLEFELYGQILKKSDFTWGAGLTASHVKSTVTKLYGGQDIIWYDATPDLTVDGRPATYDYSNASEVIIGDANPWLFGGLNTDFGWKGLALSFN